MKEASGQLTFRTLGFYIVVAVLVVAVFTASLLVVKHSRDTTSAATQARSSDERTHAHVLAVTTTPTKSQAGSVGADKPTDQGQAWDSAVATNEPTVGGTAPAPDETAPAQAAVPSQASQSSPPVSTPAAEQPAAPAESKPDPSPGLLTTLTDGLLGILALK